MATALTHFQPTVVWLRAGDTVTRVGDVTYPTPRRVVRARWANRSQIALTTVPASTPDGAENPTASRVDTFPPDIPADLCPPF